MALVIDEEPPLFKMADLTYTNRKIEEEEDFQKKEMSKTSIAMRIQKYLGPNFFDFLEIFNAVISFVLASFFAVNTYFNKDPRSIDEAIPEWTELAELVVMILLVIDYLIFFFISENKIVYLFNF